MIVFVISAANTILFQFVMETVSWVMSDCARLLLTLGAHVPQGYDSCLCLSVSPYSHPTAYKADSDHH